MSRFSIAAIGADRPGIVAAVTGVLTDRACNLEDTAMAILGGHFSMMLVVSGPTDLDAATLEAALTPVANELHLVTMVRAIDAAVAVPESGELWTVSVHGADHPGIVHGIAQALADMNVNVVDLATRVVPGDGGPAYVMVLDVTLPDDVDGDALNARLDAVGAELGVSCKAHESEADIL
ncbi:MAG: glycine cleavage system transcriptional repressor [Actinomycetota bacterium]|jgi:glycine cleavage system transcriptional repressor